jgi:prolyl-tRNA editing enzyme YbaK/EbsC (Cys-tRNA(Pro) deacylase)
MYRRRANGTQFVEMSPMSLESVRAFFAEKAPDIAVIESPISSATVALAAEAYGVEPARIAKTLSLRIGERVVLIVAAGTARMDNKKVKTFFGGKPKMLGVDEVAEITGHEVGGVCPFGLKTPLPVYCDVSLKAFDIVVPAAGSTTARCASRRYGWPNSAPPNGSMCARSRSNGYARLLVVERSWWLNIVRSRLNIVGSLLSSPAP